MTTDRSSVKKTLQRTVVPVGGLDCRDCALRLEQTLRALPGVHTADVLWGSGELAIVYDPERTRPQELQEAVRRAGYAPSEGAGGTNPARSFLLLLGAVFGAVLFLAVVGEWMGLLDEVSRKLPWPVWVAAIALGGAPIFRNVLHAALRGRVIAHTLMTVGMLAAVAVGEWAAATVIVFFMRVGEFTERFTRERAQDAVRHLVRLSPQTARVERHGREVEVPAGAVQRGEVVVVRPGEAVPVDGEVLEGTAAVDQAALTGEAMPVEVGPGAQVFAASVVRTGYLRIRATAVGPESTFGRVVRLVQEAERNRGAVQLAADRFSGYYLPVVAAVALLTFLLRRDPMATAAVLVVACSCSFALATPVAMLACLGAAARHGVLIKGGRFVELLARSDLVLVDKTGTLTLGRPELVEIVPLDGTEQEILRLAASAEKFSEHPLAEAIRHAARVRGVAAPSPDRFEALVGFGVRAKVAGHVVEVTKPNYLPASADAVAARLEQEGKTVVAVSKDGRVVGLLAFADRPRPGVVAAIQRLRELGIRHVELLTGDNEQAAEAVARPLGIRWRARLLPEEKISVVRSYQAQGYTVVMVGDGVNDAPALAQAQVGVAMGSVGTALAAEAAHVVLLREDWSLLPRLLLLARRAMRTVWFNLGFTVLYNAVGLLLAALGLLPPTLAAALQSLPDLFILGNSSRLLRRL